jgi:hypothetical protein
MRLVAISVVSWLTGLAVYVAALSLVWHQSLHGGDLQAVVFWSVLASALAIVVAHAPLMFALKRWIAPAAWWPFALAGVGAGVVPVALIIWAFDGGLRAATSPEALLFGLMFAAFGFVFGVGFFLAYGRVST